MSSYQTQNDIQQTAIHPGKYLTQFQRKLLQENLQKNLPDSYRQRIEIMLLADEGKSQAEICQSLNCCPATVRHWTHIARAGIAHQWQDCPIGRPKAVSEEYLQRLRELISNSPRDYGYSFRRWTTNWLQKHLAKELGITMSDRHFKRLLKQMGLSTRAKPNNTQDNANDKKPNAKILITDLKSTNIDDNSEPLPLHFVKLDKNSDIYGATSIRAISYSRTVPHDFGTFSFRHRIPTLPQPS
ncbi:helix-turn-helix domain-containing protein [Nostoc sp. FACHB-280]|uniref:helix-turn-helix domain-containing protein n=1 Tax=Nostoc sp. FACHB-280 TaxID=2692839 RepID=UPI00168B46DA|nr:helix-turn-helix domain-containing protein [Nostoc sp. FACHB-280]MBD2495827.1 helix-turn-helix domain-containing protein [Nostoc sp. FACHB-280]